MNVGLPPRHAIPSIPSVRLPLDRAAAALRRLQAQQTLSAIRRVRFPELRLPRGERPDATPGLGPLRLDRGLELDPSERSRTSFAALAPATQRASAAGRAVVHGLSASFDRVSAGVARLPLDRLPLDRLRSAGLSRGRLPLDRLGAVGRLDGRVLVALGVMIVVSVYGLLFANPAANRSEEVAAAQVAQRAAPAAKPAADAPPANPFEQGAINDSLRALRKTVGPGYQARNLLLLGDGTLGTTVVHEGVAENVMVRGKDLAIEPLASEPEQGATLNLERVHGTSITRVLERAATVYRLPAKQLGSLRLTEHPSKPGTFIWTGVWTDTDRTTLYADREGTTLAPTRPR